MWRSQLLISIALTAVSTGLQLRPLCLQQRDVPKGFSQTVSRPVSNQDIGKLMHLPAQLFAQRLGRISGYETDYKKVTTSGPAWITSIVSELQSVDGAEELDWLNARAAKAARAYGSPYRRWVGVRVGDGTSAWVCTFHAAGRKYVLWTVYFHRGRLEAAMDVEAPVGIFREGTVLALARTIDSRFKRYLRE